MAILSLPVWKYAISKCEIVLVTSWTIILTLNVLVDPLRCYLNL